MSNCEAPLLIACGIGLLGFLIYKAFFSGLTPSKKPKYVTEDDLLEFKRQVKRRLLDLDRRGLVELTAKDVKKGMKVWVYDKDCDYRWPTIVIGVNETMFYYDCNMPTGCIHSRRFSEVSVWAEFKAKK